MWQLPIGDQMELDDSLINRGLFQKEQAFICKGFQLCMDMDATVEYGIERHNLSKNRLNYWINVYMGTVLQELNYL